jgi:peptidyl-prolyl cis-trans isomerase SurA
MNNLTRLVLIVVVVAVVIGALFYFGVIPGWTRSHGGGVVARVNGRDINTAELERIYKQEIAQAPPEPLDAAQINTAKLGILQKLIETELLMQQAEKVGVLATDDEVNERMTQERAPFTSEEFQKRLKEEGLTEDELRRQVRIELTRQKLLNKEVNSKITITDADISDYYNSHKAEFNLIEPMYQVGVIRVYFGGETELPNQKPHTQAEAMELIRMIYNRLQSGEDFSSVAIRYSEDARTRNTGGLAGAFPESGLRSQSAAARDALLKMKAGQISGILPYVDPGSRQTIGYEILKLLGREPAGQRQLSDSAVQNYIRTKLRGNREGLLSAAFFESVRNQAHIEDYFADEVLKTNGSK